MTELTLFIERAYGISCHRCANEGAHYPDPDQDESDAAAWFNHLGWSADDANFVTCPACNGVSR